MKLLIALLYCLAVWLDSVSSIIFYQGRTTACDTCDRVSTNSVRNTLCCLKFSKCCIPDTLDAYNARVAAEDALYYGQAQQPSPTSGTSRKRASTSTRRKKTGNKKKRSKNKNQTSKRQRTSVI